jgi:hypothetical protein
MARLILHIGMSKAGSTAIQRCLAQNRGLLLVNGITYCDVIKGPNHAQLAVAFSERPHRLARMFGVRREQDRQALRTRMQHRFARAVAADSTWIASSEHIGAWLRHPHEISALAHFVGEFFSEVTLVTVVRRSDYWLPSSYVESVKAGGVQPLDEAFVHRRRGALLYGRHVRRWEAVFGRGSMVTVPFLESDTETPTALPCRFLEAVGVAGAASQPWVFPAGLANESISAHATEILRHLNPALRTQALRATTLRRRAASLVSSEYPGDRITLTPAASAALPPIRWLDDGVISGTRPREWSTWLEQPPAPVRPLPEIAADDLAAAAALLERHGLLREPSGGRLREDVAVSVRDAVLRLARR